jgi:hypothetical protein
MEFREFVRQSDADYPEEIIGLAVYHLMVHEGEEKVDGSMVHDFLSLYDYSISRSAISAKLAQLSNRDKIKKTGADSSRSGYIMTPEGMTEFENISPYSEDSPLKNSSDIHSTSVSQTKNKWDAFISYSGKDKTDFVQPLADELSKLGLDVWYADFEISVGDSIPRSINEGMEKSDYGIPVLSESYFNRDWPQEELESLIQQNVSGEDKVILPVCYKLDPEEISSYNTILAKLHIISGNQDNVSGIAREVCNEIRSNEWDPVERDEVDELMEETIHHIVETTGEVLESDQLNRFFDQMGHDIDWNKAREGEIREFIGTNPVTASRKGITLEKEKNSAIKEVIDNINNPEEVLKVVEKLALPETHIRNPERQEQTIEYLNEILEHENLRINLDGQLQKMV